jgi:two-component system LytT family response regulator
MKKLRALIVEDEAPARDLIKAFLKDHEDVELIGESDNGFDAVKMINSEHPDLVFLDIQMPKLTGFEMIELLDEVPEIIFTTAFDQYAIKAFELNAVDYIMKPFSRERFAGALEKVKERIQQKNPEPKVQKFVRQMKEKEEVSEIERIFVKTGSRIDVIPVAEIIRIEAQDDYVDIVTAKGKFLKKETMNYLEKALPGDTFVRVHRSGIVNINYIQKIEKYGKESSMVVLKDGSRVQVSKSRIKDLKNQLGF